MRKEKIINLPNILALIRLLLVPVVVWLIFQERMITAMFVFLAACLTDLLAGYMALAGSVASMVQYAWRSWDKLFPKHEEKKAQ